MTRTHWDEGRWALGLMSGTSMDGIDAALLRSDGNGVVTPGPFASFPYDPAFRARLRRLLGGGHPVELVERELTLLHGDAVDALLSRNHIDRTQVALVGFHGQTILHAPAQRRTWQIGDGALLARRTGLDVVADFRSRDVAEGGEGAPLAPLYHAALSAELERPLAVLNLGGVANVTWIGEEDHEILAFDTGPGNALIDDWMLRHTGKPYDRNGALAAQGQARETAVAQLMADPYFARLPPKSLDRDAFDVTPIDGLPTADGAATLTAFTVAAVAAARAHFPAPALHWLVTGGGRHNRTLMALLAERLTAPVAPVEDHGWNGDALEAQAFAYLAIRSVLGLPLTLPTTTGVAAPTTGGVLHRA
jgi:anhydro-N-acetylmuramic acid kinase